MIPTALLKRAASAALVLALCTAAFALNSCSGYDPNVNNIQQTEEGTQGDSAFETAAQTEAPLLPEGNFAYIGGGRDQVREINGVSVDVGAYARRSYELFYLLGQTSFNSPSEINLDSAVQFAFCHLFYNELWMMPRSGYQLKTASEEQITKKLSEYFGGTTFDVTKSTYYRSDLGAFEIVLPIQYGSNIFYTVDAAESDSEGKYFMIYTSFYKDSNKKNLRGRTVLSLSVADGAVTIASLSSEY